MDSKEMCRLGLNLPEPWYVEEVYMEQIDSELILHIDISHRKGSRFEYDGESYSVYDHQDRTWQHLKFFQHRYDRIQTPSKTSGRNTLRKIQTVFQCYRLILFVISGFQSS